MKKRVVVTLKDGPEGQSLTLPRDFCLDGDSVRISKTKNGLILTPRYVDVKKWRAALAKYSDTPFLLDDTQEEELT